MIFEKLIRNSEATTGTLNAVFHNEFKFSHYNGVAYFLFLFDPHVILFTKQQLTDTTWNEFSMSFSKDITAGRYEIKPNHPMFPNLPALSENWYEGDNYSRNYKTDDNAGHVEVEHFDLEKGIFKAKFNVTILNNEKRHQTIGEIDVSGWSA